MTFLIFWLSSIVITWILIFSISLALDGQITVRDLLLTTLFSLIPILNIIMLGVFIGLWIYMLLEDKNSWMYSTLIKLDKDKKEDEEED